MKPVTRPLAALVLLAGACTLLLLWALPPGQGGPTPLRVHLDDVTPRSVVVTAEGTASRPGRLHLALLATAARSCPRAPTAAAQRATVRTRSTQWQSTRRLSARTGGLAASLRGPDELSNAGRVCAWLISKRGAMASVLARASDDHSRNWLATARSGLIVVAAMAIAAIALFFVAARVSIMRARARERRTSPFLAPGAPTVQAARAAAPARPPVAVAATGSHAAADSGVKARPRIGGHDGDIRWDGAPEPPPVLDPTQLTTFRPDDPRLN